MSAYHEKGLILESSSDWVPARFTSDLRWYLFFSYWQVIWTVLYKGGVVPLSPYPSLVATVFFLPFIFFGVRNINGGYLAFNFIWHVLLLVFIRPDLRGITVCGNLVVFGIYILFLRTFERDFFKLYFFDTRRYMGQRGLTLSRYFSSFK